jgi:hypothetical protein
MGNHEGRQMNTCGTCKYFGEACGPETFYEVEGSVPTHGHKRVDFESPYHVCDLIVMKPEYEEKLKLMPGNPDSPAAYVQDASDYHAVLCVREEFGCNQWQIKEQGPT